MTKFVRTMGETIQLDKLVKHYRQCARWWPGSATFWRLRLRTVIRQYREQQAELAEHREAA